MTQEDKELLLKDLCARLPYGVKVNVIYSNENASSFRQRVCVEGDNELNTDIIGLYQHDEIDIRPYLFPLSSMTEEQRNDISKLLIDTQKEFPPYGELNIKGCDNLFICTVKQANALINYCLTHHLDINGLIEKGLALDATGLNIY
jgi:phosphoribosylaminoimidazole-succinocarboxamide synthase